MNLSSFITLIYNITINTHFDTDTEEFYEYNHHTKTYSLSSHENLLYEIDEINFYEKTIPLKNPTSEDHFTTRFDPITNIHYFTHPEKIYYYLPLIPTTQTPPIHTCREPQISTMTEETDDIPFWYLINESKIHFLFYWTLYKSPMISNMNENFDSFNPDDLESSDYSYLYETYNHHDDYDSEDNTPDYYW